VRFFDYLGSQAASSLHRRVKIVYLEPQQDAVSRRRRRCVDEVRVVFLVPSVQLKNQPASARDPIVDVAVAVFWKRVCAKQLAVPETAFPDIAHGYQRLGLDGRSLRRETHEAVLLMIAVILCGCSDRVAKGILHCIAKRETSLAVEPLPN